MLVHLHRHLVSNQMKNIQSRRDRTDVCQILTLALCVQKHILSTQLHTGLSLSTVKEQLHKDVMMVGYCINGLLAKHVVSL